MTWIDSPDGTLAFTRGTGFACVINYTDHRTWLPSGLESAQPILASGGSPRGTLAPATAAWFRLDPAAGAGEPSVTSN
jgi:alpha-glucosidase